MYDGSPYGRDDELVISTVDEPARSIVALAGDGDRHSEAALDQEFTRLAEEGVSEVVLDLGGVEFLDSSGLRTLVTGRSRLQAAGARLSLRGVSPKMARIFDFTGLSPVFAPDA
ncbi:anti-sigma factor antagonist BldG [soil metagenome]